MCSVKYVGMDVHKSITVIAVLNSRGHVESQSQVRTKPDNIADFFRGLSGRVEVVLEEGMHSTWLNQLLTTTVVVARIGPQCACSAPAWPSADVFSAIATRRQHSPPAALAARPATR